jgi:hypothetical protein
MDNNKCVPSWQAPLNVVTKEYSQCDELSMAP